MPNDAQPELVPIADLRPRDQNPRKNAKAIEPVAASIKRFGFVRPIIANTHPDEPGAVIVGHTALAAAKSLGLDRVPVRWVRLPRAEADAAALADNKLGEIAGWDDSLLREMFAADGFDFDLARIAGFTQGEIDRLLASTMTDAGAAGTAPAEPVTRPGDLWILGRHRLICGDSTDAATVARVLDGQRPALLVTDPPYGVSYDPAWRNAALGDRWKGSRNVGGGRRAGTVRNDDQADWTAVWRLADFCSVAYVWCAPGPLMCAVAASLEGVGFELRPTIVWAKRHFVIGRGHYHTKHEACWYGVRKGAAAAWQGGRSQTTLWDDIGQDPTESVEAVSTGHGTQKPLECMARPIRNHAGNVFEPFLGSGTTLIAAEQLDRRCFAVELNPAYCDLAVARWEALTGAKAQRVAATAATEPKPPRRAARRPADGAARARASKARATKAKPPARARARAQA